MFKLKRPCSNCPFTSQPNAIKLRRERVEELAEGATEDDWFNFYCHATLDYDSDDDDDERAPIQPGAQLCVGAMGLALATQGLTVAMRVGILTKQFDPAALDTTTCYTSAEEMIDGATED